MKYLLFILFLLSCCCVMSQENLDVWLFRKSFDSTKYRDRFGNVAPHKLLFLSDYGIHASDGIPDGKAIQNLIDSLEGIPGNFLLVPDEPGNYCTEDAVNETIAWDYTGRKPGFVMYCFHSWFYTSVSFGPCDKPKKAF
jgi:hypothetical protein